MKYLFVAAVFVVLALVFGFSYNIVSQQISLVHTQDTLAQCLLAASRLNKENVVITEDKIVSKVFELDPSNDVANGMLLDGWGKPISIQIERGETIIVSVSSMGKDLKEQTADDLAKEAAFTAE